MSATLLLPQLPADALLEILSRLPADSILRFKCVCKSWYALFTNNPTFAAKHLQLTKSNHDNNQHVFLKHSLHSNDGNKKWLTCSLKHPFESQYERQVVVVDDDVDDLLLIGHCDGLVALALGKYGQDGVILCNPATRESRTLPNSSIPYGLSTYIGSSFQPAYLDDVGGVVYDVVVVNNCIGFGYDRKTKDYKVVRDVMFFWQKTDTVTHRVEVFSVGTDSWREIDGGDTIGEAMSVPGGDGHFEQYFDGLYYWWGREKEGNVLISFDMADEVFRKMTVPHFCDPRIGVYNNECIALYVTDIPSGLMDVWVLKEFGVKESLRKQLTITASAVQMNHPLLFWKNNEEMLYEEVLPDEEQGRLFSYNLITHESKCISLRGCCSSFSARRYIKTIVSVSGGAELNQVINMA